MSSHSKRRAESEEVAHKKKPRKGEDDEFKPDKEDDAVELEDEVLDKVDESNVISTGRRTRGTRDDYTEGVNIAGPGDDAGLESDGVQNGKKPTSTASPTRSPQGKVETNIEERDEDEDEDDEEEYEDGDEGDDVEDYAAGEDDEDEEEEE